MNTKSRFSYILTVFAGVCLVGCGGCQQKQAEDVPALNQDAKGADEAAAKAKADADAAAAAEAAKAKAEEEAAKAAKEKADAEAQAAAEKQAAEEAAMRAKAEADAKAAEEAAKVAAEKQEAEAMAAAKAAAEAQAKAEEEAKVAAEAQAAAEKQAAEEAAARVAAEEAARKSAQPLPATKVAASEVPAIAKGMAAGFVANEIPNIFGATHGRIVVQVNRPTNSTDLAVNRAEVHKSVNSAFEGVNDVITAENVNGKHNVHRPKAIHLAFEEESKALRIIPSRSVRNAPDVIVNSAVTQDEKGALITLKATDTRTGKVFWTESKPLAGEEVAVPVSETPAPETPAPAEDAAEAPDAK